GKIDADAITEHVIEGIALRDIDARLADHHAELDFPIDTLCLARHHEIVGGPAQRAGGFQKERRLLWQRQADFLGMIVIIEPDADDLADAAQWRTELGILRRFRQRFYRHRGDSFNVGKAWRARLQHRKAARQIEDFAIENETRLLAGCRTVTDKLHGLYNNRG